MKFRVPKNLVEYLCNGKREDLKTMTYRDEMNRKEMLTAGATSLKGKKKRRITKKNSERKTVLTKWRKVNQIDRQTGESICENSQPAVEVLNSTRLEARHLCGYLENQIGRVQLQGEETQLLLRLDATTKGGEKKQLLALVDTGAQVNLFAQGCFTLVTRQKPKTP